MVMHGVSNLSATIMMSLTPGTPTVLLFPLNAQSERIRPRHARITVEGNPCRWGKNPSGAIGQLVSATPPNNVVSFEDATNDYTGLLQQIQFIALGGVATLQINYMT